jgi:prepilin signal peptidase PulO-like enzyme (type II secretory pathway)
VVDNFFYLYFFIVGCLLGSFLNAISDRIHLKKDFLVSRSRCDFCKKALSPIDLIPVFSFLINGFRCRLCRHKISWFYPFSEILTGFVFVLIYRLFIQYGFDFKILIYLSVMLSIFTIILLSDLKFFEIPFSMVVFGSIFCILYRIFVLGNLTLENIIWEVLSIVIIFIFFASVILISKGGMGGGDLKLSMLISLFIGYQNVTQSLYLGFLIGGFFSIVMMMLRKKSLKSKIPLGPFLIIGTIFTLFYPNFLHDLVNGNFLTFVL